MLLLESVPTLAAVRNVKDTTSIPGWTMEVSNIDGGGYIDSSEKASGKNSMKLYNNTVKSSDTTFLRISYPVSVKKGRKYCYGFKLKAKNAERVTSQMNWITPRSNLIPTGGTAGWRDFEFVYTHVGDDGTAYMRIILDTKTEAVWVDDVYFYDANDKSRTNLIKNPSFEDGGAVMAETSAMSADGKSLMTIPSESIEVDADLSDWEGIRPMDLAKTTVYAGDGLSLSANIRYAYDDDNFYFAIEAEDDVHNPILVDSYWNGDGLQFTLCGPDDTFGKAYAFSCDPETGEKFINASGNLDCSFKRDGTKSIYEVAIPWTDYFADGKQDAALFCCIINENDNDGLGRKGCLETSAGIADRKNSEAYPLMLMAGDGREFEAWVTGDKSCYAGKSALHKLNLYNFSDKALSISLYSKKANINKSVNVPANSVYDLDFEVKHKDMGETTVDLKVSDGSTEKNFDIKTTVYANKELAKEVISKHKANYKEITPLIKECQNKGMPLDYEEINYNILGHFTSYMEEALEKNDLVRIHHQDKVLTELYEDLKLKLNSYLDGSAKPIAAPTYVTSDISVSGKHFEATMDIDGKLEQRPVFFIGTGHWAPSRKDIPILSKFGFNSIQPEIGGSNFMNKAHSVRSWRFASKNNYKSNDSVDTKEKHGGNYSIKITATDEHIKNYYWYMYQKIDVKPNTTYKYGLWAKSNDASFSWFTVDKTMSMDRRCTLNGTYDWKEHAYEFTTGPKETSIQFMIFNEAPTTGLWIDDAYLMEKGSNTNLLQNGDFEAVNTDYDVYWDIDERVIDELADDFDLMAEHNISGIFSTAPHYVPGEYMVDYPEVASGQAEFSKFTPDSPKAMEYFETYYRLVMPRLMDKVAFDGIILMNEPTFYSYKTPYYLPLFRDSMKEKYGDIASLNARWGTDYADFSEITMPSYIEKTPRFYDWRVFNDEILPEFYNRITEIIREYSDVPTQTKIMQTTGISSGGRLQGGNNWEVMSETVDINGCDGWAYYGSQTQDIRAQSIFYDLQTSIKEAPSYNTEDHIIPDASIMTFSDEELQYNVATMWQGALHGKSGSILWFWDRETRSEHGNYLHNPLLTERPDTVAAIGKLTLDLNRLSKEVVSILESDANVGMLYSLNSWPYAKDSMNTIYHAYASVGQNGQKTQFIVESQIDKLKDMKCLIVPHSVSVTDETFAAIENFVANGGKLVVLGNDSLSRNEYGDERNSDTVGALMSKADVVDTTSVGTDLDKQSVKAVSDLISEVLTREKYSVVSVIELSTGKPVESCEYFYAEYEGKYIVNICTYRNDDVDAVIYINGTPVNKVTDLINLTDSGAQVKLEAYNPMLISIDK